MTIDDEIQEKIKRIFNVQIIYISAEKDSIEGRPSKGFCWIVPNDTKFKLKIISKRISMIKMSNLKIVGVYLPYYDGKPEGRIEFEMELDTLSNICAEKRKKNETLIITGDLNSDIKSGNPHNRFCRKEFTIYCRN